MSLLPQGFRLTRGNHTKLRCLQIHDTTLFYDNFWKNFNQTAVLAQLQQAKATGFNSVKVYCDGMASLGGDGNPSLAGVGYPADSILLSRVSWFIQQCRALGLRIYLAMNQSIEFYASSTATTTANLATQAKILGWWTALASDLVVAVDLCNECNTTNPGGGTIWGTPNFTTVNAAGTAGLTQLVQMGRAACPFPITISVFVNTDTDTGVNGFIDLQFSLGCDFHDIHLYKGFVSTNWPKLSDISALKSRSKYIGAFVQGECGTGYPGGTDGVTRPQGWQTFWANQMGDIARDPDSRGAVWFCAIPYDNGQGTGLNPSDYNLLDANNSNPNAAIAAACQRWPAL